MQVVSTVIMSRAAAAFLAWFLIVPLVAGAPFSGPAVGVTSPRTLVWAFLVAALAVVLVSAVVTWALLPRMASIRVGLGTAILATLAGDLVPVVGLLLTAELAGHAVSSSTLLVFSGMTPLLGLGLTVGGIALTVWMLQTSALPGPMQTSALPGPSGGARDDLYDQGYRQSPDA